MVMLREKENELAMELTKYKNRHIEMSQLMKSVSEYRDALSIQVERLNITEWLDEKARKEHICPVCQQKCSDDSLSYFHYIGSSGIFLNFSVLST